MTESSSNNRNTSDLLNGQRLDGTGHDPGAASSQTESVPGQSVGFRTSDMFWPMLPLFAFSVTVLLITAHSARLSTRGDVQILVIAVFMVGYIVHKVARHEDGFFACGLSMKAGVPNWGLSGLVALIWFPVVWGAGAINQCLLRQLPRGWLSQAGGGDFTFGFSGLEALLLETLIVHRGRFAVVYVFFLGLAVLVPFYEEIWFRGIGMAGYLKMGGKLRALLYTSLAFGAVHGAREFLPTMAMGLLLGVLRLKGGSLWPCIVLHGLNNLIAFALLYRQVA